MGTNYNNIISLPLIETKCKEHYDFIKKHFCDAYITEEQFLKRDDYFVVLKRDNDNYIVALCLVRNTPIVDRIPIPIIPTSEIESKSKPEYWILNNGDYTNPNKLKSKQKDNFDNLLQSLINYKIIPKKRKVRVIRYNVHRIVFTLVDMHYRGKGYNQELLNFVFENSKKDDTVRYNVASIRKSNEPSIKSFLKNGYKISNLTMKPYKNGEEKIRVVKYIKEEDEIKSKETEVKTDNELHIS